MKQKQTATSEVDQLKLDEFPTRAKCAGQKRLLVYLRQRQFSVAPPGLTGSATSSLGTAMSTNLGVQIREWLARQVRSVSVLRTPIPDRSPTSAHLLLSSVHLLNIDGTW